MWCLMPPAADPTQGMERRCSGGQVEGGCKRDLNSRMIQVIIAVCIVIMPLVLLYMMRMMVVWMLVMDQVLRRDQEGRCTG